MVWQHFHIALGQRCDDGYTNRSRGAQVAGHVVGKAPLIKTETVGTEESLKLGASGGIVAQDDLDPPVSHGGGVCHAKLGNLEEMLELIVRFGE